MVKPVHLSNGRVWRIQTDALAHFKAMLARYSVGDVISAAEDHADLCSLLARYDAASRDGSSKIGCGIDHFSKQRNGGEGWSSEGFHVHRTDGSVDDFSYKNAVTCKPLPS